MKSDFKNKEFDILEIYKDYSEVNLKLRKFYLVWVIDWCERLEKLEIWRIGYDYFFGYILRIIGIVVDEFWWVGIWILNGMIGFWLKRNK